SSDKVFQRAYSVDTDSYRVTSGEREVVAGDDARPSHQEDSVGETAIAKQELRQLRQLALQLNQRRATRVCHLAIARDFQLDSRLGGWRRRKQNAGTDGAAAVINFRLRQIERILSFNIARAHVIANRVTGDRALGIHKES